MFRAHVLIVRMSKLYYTASGIITLIGGRPVHRCTGWPPGECDDTKGCIVQFWPPDDEHMCSKRVEAWNKLIIKFSASSLLILRKMILKCSLLLPPDCAFGHPACPPSDVLCPLNGWGFRMWRQLLLCTACVLALCTIN